MYTIDVHIRQCPLPVEDFASMAKNKNGTNCVCAKQEPMKQEKTYYVTYLVGGIPTHLKNMSSSVGMMKFPTECETVPNHLPDIISVWLNMVITIP